MVLPKVVAAETLFR